MIKMVIMMIQNEFDNEVKYRLFRRVNEILHPSISKKNISDYTIIMEEDLLPVRVFYPKKVTGISHVIIYLHGNAIVTDCNQQYSAICKDFAKELDCLVIAVEYVEENYKDMYQKTSQVVRYLVERLVIDGIEKDNIYVMGDSTGANMILSMHMDPLYEAPKEILFYPVISMEYFNQSSFLSLTTNKDFNFDLVDHLQEYISDISLKDSLDDPLVLPLKREDKVPKTLLLVGKVDSLLDEDKAYADQYRGFVTYVEIPFAGHGFLKSMDLELQEEVYSEIKKFMK